MFRNNRIIAVLAGFAILFLLGQIFFVPKQYVNSRIISALQWPFTLFKYFGNQQDLVRQLSSLALENQSLRAQLLENQNQPQLVKDGKESYVSARIFSAYPFNTDDKILINAGKNAGLEIGQIVLAAKGIFLGKVIEVNEKTSAVQTILTPGWELAVKIGEKRVDALYVGSRAPRLTLISKAKTIQEGEPVYLVNKDWPFGLTIGAVGGVSAGGSGPFQEAGLVLPFKFNELDRVLVPLQ